MNKKWVVLFLVILIFQTTASFAADSIPLSVSNAAKSVVRITVNNSFGSENISGIVIDKDKKYVLTNLSDVEGAGSITVGSNGEENISVAGIIASSKEKNLAVMELKEELENVRDAKIKKDDIENGTNVYAVKYYSRDSIEEILQGTVNSKNMYTSSKGENCEIYQITANINLQNNGGALVDKRGNLVGINFYDGNTEQNKAITSNEIISLLDEKGISYKKATVLYFVLLIIAVTALICAAVVLIYKRVIKKKFPYIVGVSGEFEGQKIPVGKENISIGRDAKYCQIVLINDDKASRCHCSIHYDKIKNMFVLTDLASTHGTYKTDGVKLEPKTPVYLGNGEMFKIGDGINVFRVCTGGDIV